MAQVVPFPTAPLRSSDVQSRARWRQRAGGVGRPGRGQRSASAAAGDAQVVGDGRAAIHAATGCSRLRKKACGWGPGRRGPWRGLGW